MDLLLGSTTEPFYFVLIWFRDMLKGLTPKLPSSGNTQLHLHSLVSWLYQITFILAYLNGELSSAWHLFSFNKLGVYPQHNTTKSFNSAGNDPKRFATSLWLAMLAMLSDWPIPLSQSLSFIVFIQLATLRWLCLAALNWFGFGLSLTSKNNL